MYRRAELVYPTWPRPGRPYPLLMYPFTAAIAT